MKLGENIHLKSTYFMLLEYQLDWIKIVDFYLWPNFWPFYFFLDHPLYLPFLGMNMCRSLVHTPLFNCPYKSAICLSTIGPEGQRSFTNLGQISSGPYLDEHNRLVIHYTNGGLCKNQDTEETHISTKIIFK